MAELDRKSELAISISDLAEFLEIKPEKLLPKLKKLGFAGGQYVLPDLVRPVVLDSGFSYPQKVVSVQMLKGGVAKTTTVLNIGLRAAMLGARVLMVDLDQQANLTFALGDETENQPVWLDIVEKKVKIQDAIKKIDSFLHLIPSSLNNSVLDRVLLNSNRNWAQSVAAPLEQIKKQYDLILIDTAPAISAINTAVTVASDQVILPLNPDKFAYLGMQKNMAEIAEVAKDFSREIECKILFTKFDGREKFSHELLQKCLEQFDDQLMKSYIRTSAEVKNTIRTSKNIFQSKSGVKEDYDAIAKEVLGFN